MINSVAALSVLSWNILCAGCSEATYPTWEERKEEVMRSILEKDADVVALQEVNATSRDYIASVLHEYNRCSAGGVWAEEPIFIKKSLAYSCTEGVAINAGNTCTTATIEGVPYFNCHLPVPAYELEYYYNVVADVLPAKFVWMGDFNFSTIHLSYLQTALDGAYLNMPKNEYDKIVVSKGSCITHMVVHYDLKLDKLSDHAMVEGRTASCGALLIPPIMLLLN